MSNNVSMNANGNIIILASTNTGTNAISVSNNVSSIILYAPQGTISIGNNASADGLIGNAITLGNGVNITYTNNLQSFIVSHASGSGWTYQVGSFAIVQ